MILLSTLVGSCVGAILLTLLTLLFHGIFFRDTWKDGQYAFVFFLTLPLGCLLGGLTGLLRAYHARGQEIEAGRIALGSGVVLSVVFLWLGWFVFSGTQKPTLLDRLGATVFWFGIPLLWSGWLLLMGLRGRLAP